MSFREELRRTGKILTLVSTLGFSMALAIVIGALIGYYFDKWLGKYSEWVATYHVGFFFWLIIGIIAGYRNIFIIMRKAKDKEF